MKRTVLLALILCPLGADVAVAACDATSAPMTAALIELYTSEGCSSCPPADERLRALAGKDYRPDQVVPLALHVDYWDGLGWKDPYAKPEFSARQSWLTHLNHHQTVYTPHFFVAGREIRSWREDLDQAVMRAMAAPSPVKLHIRAQSATPGTLTVEVAASAPAGKDPLELYVALTQSNLSTAVGAGENAGTVLKHDHVVRDWLGPFELVDGKVSAEKQLSVPPSWTASQLGLVAFVQNARSGEVLQALGARDCAAD